MSIVQAVFFLERRQTDRLSDAADHRTYTPATATAGVGKYVQIAFPSHELLLVLYRTRWWATARRSETETTTSLYSRTYGYGYDFFRRRTRLVLCDRPFVV